MRAQPVTKRDTLFISKATPGDDEFVLWLAPRLEAAGYNVFADILSLEPGDRWRKQVTNTLQENAAKMLLCCRDATLDKNGVQEEIGIAEDLVKQLGDARFIIPLRLAPFKKVFGIGELQYVDFVGSWASGLRDLLETLDRQRVPRSDSVVINPNWEQYKRRMALTVQESPEMLTLNWLRVADAPAAIRYYQPRGAIDHSLMEAACDTVQFSAASYLRGLFSFASVDEIERAFSRVGTFSLHSEHDLTYFLQEGARSPEIERHEARNLVSAMFRVVWERYCRAKGLAEYAFSSQLGFHVTRDLAPLGKKIPWGQRRSAMLRNSAGGKVWEYGVSANPYLWPMLHFKLKARVLFSDLAGNEAGALITDVNEQHRLRRSVCKGWRNKAWHGRLMAFLQLLAGQSAQISLSLGRDSMLNLDVQPMSVTSPVTTALPDEMSDDAEEQDPSTLGQFILEDTTD